MSRLATLVVALLLVTAGCTAAGTQSASSDGDIVRSNESVDSTTAEPTREEAAASAVSETATDAQSAAAPATDADEETAGSGSETTETQSNDGSESDSSGESAASTDDDTSGSSAPDASADEDEEGSDPSSDGASDTGESDADESDASAADAPENETTIPAAETDSVEEQTEWNVTVTTVADGDSLLVEFPDGHLEKVDLVGVDAPDGEYAEDDYLGMATEDGGEAWLNDWGGKVTGFVSDEVGGQDVRIYVDSVADRRDDAGTLQVYVDDGDTATLNADLVERGYAEVADYSFSKEEEFKQEEENAYQGHDGLWRFYEPDPLAGLPDASDETTTETGTETETETPTETETDSVEEQTEWTVTVTMAADGDSLLAEFPDGHLEKVDLVGVDAPDGDYSEDDYLGMATEDGGEAWLNDWGGKATDFVAGEVEGREVTIYVDSVADRRDDAGTLQVYVDDGDSATLNADLIERGYAEVADYSFSEKETFEQEEENAYQGYNGLWRFYEPNPLADLPDADEETETEVETETATPDVETETETATATATATPTAATETETATATQTGTETVVESTSTEPETATNASA